MLERKNITVTLNEFSKKMTALKKGADFFIRENTSEIKNLQEKINQDEEERINYLKSRFADYLEPVTKEVEEDEENLMKAYNLFCQINEITEKLTDRSTHLKSHLIASPLCCKSEYTSDLPSENFSFLRLWFLVKNPESNFVPEIVKLENIPESYAIDFIDIDMWYQTSLEKEILQLT